MLLISSLIIVQNPLVVGDLFGRQCKPWQAISQKLVEWIHEAAAVNFNKLLSEICDSNTKGRLMKGIIQPALYELRRGLKDTFAELLEPHLSIHPITYNESLADSVQETQADRHKRKFDATAQSIVNVNTDTVDTGSYDKIPLRLLLTSLLKVTEPDPREYAASLCADVAAAYYKVCILLL